MVTTAIDPEQAEEDEHLVLDLVDECYHDACEFRVSSVSEEDDGTVVITGTGLKGHPVTFRATPSGRQYVRTATGTHDVQQVQKQ